MLQAISLALGLFLTWLLWSGHTAVLLVTFGVLSVALVLYVARRMGVMDEEGVPIHLRGYIFGYWGWLLWEIVKANITVARIVLRKDMNISPTVVQVKAQQSTDLGRVIFANSVILTPATLTLDVHEGVVTVHGLTEQSAREVVEGDMNRRVAALELRSGAGREA